MLNLRFGFLALLFLPIGVAAETVVLNEKAFKHVTFDDIPPTQASYADGVVTFKVERSSSLLLTAFDDVKTVRRVRFAWQSEGDIRVKDAGQEASKKGDDFRLRVGLVLSGKAPMVPFFASAWIKAIRDHLKHESNAMLYLVIDTKNPAGKRWPSPYADSLEYMSVPSKNDAKTGWQSVDVRLDPLKVVGLWLMADGDNTRSRFISRLRDLQLN